MTIAYTVHCRIQTPDKAAAWLAWLKNGHLDDVIAGGAQSAEIVQIDNDGAEESIFEVRYRFESRDAYDVYIRDHAPRLRAEGLKLFPPEDGFVYSRTVGKIF
jgi:hypothetical protein